MGLPQSSNPVFIEDDIVADDRKILRLRLRDQHAIEWVAMRAGQRSGSDPMSSADR